MTKEAGFGGNAAVEGDRVVFGSHSNALEGKYAGLEGVWMREILRRVLFGGAAVPDWHADAACRTADHELFFPGVVAGSRARSMAAKRICQRCAVRARCLEDVMAFEADDQRHGIAGGLTSRQRHLLARVSQPQPREPVDDG